MANLRELHKKTTVFIARFTLAGVPVLDATGVIFIYRVSDKKYWNGSTFVTTRVSNAMTEISEINQAGDWSYSFDNSVGNAIDQYIVEIKDTAVGKSDNLIERLELAVGGYIDPIILDIKRLLGLNHENIVIEATAVAINGELTTGDVYLYDTPANATADGRTAITGLTDKYHIESPLTVEGKMTKFTQTKVTI